MKKQWLNPELENLNVNATNEITEINTDLLHRPESICSNKKCSNKTVLGSQYCLEHLGQQPVERPQPTPIS